MSILIVSSQKHKKALLITDLFFFKTSPFHFYLSDTVNTKTIIPVGVDGAYCARKMVEKCLPQSAQARNVHLFFSFSGLPRPFIGW